MIFRGRFSFRVFSYYTATEWFDGSSTLLVIAFVR